MTGIHATKITDPQDFNSTINNLDKTYKKAITTKSATLRGKAIIKLNAILRHLGFVRQFAVVDKDTTTKIAVQVCTIATDFFKSR